MKAVLLADEQAINPLYLLSGDKRGIDSIVAIPAGTEIDHPDCWRLCVIGKAVPADDECRNAVHRHTSSPVRKERIAQVKALRAADGVKQLDAKTKKWLEYMEKVYATDLDIAPDPAE